MKKNQQDYDSEVMQWLTRFEKRFGVNQTRESLQKLQSARELFFDELGYNLTRKQFETLNEVKNEQQQIEIAADIKPETGRQYKDKKTGNLFYQTNYRDVTTGRFVKH